MRRGLLHGTSPSRWTRSLTGLVTLLLVAGLAPASAFGGAANEDPPPLAVPVYDTFRADYSEPLARGVGVRFAHQPSGHHVDLRLKDYPRVVPLVTGSDATYHPALGVTVHYEGRENEVKEIITLEGTGPSEFRYDLRAPGLDLVDKGDRFVLGPPERPDLFRISRAEAWDAEGTDIPAETTLEGGELVVRLDEEALAEATAPITVDPTIEGLPAGATWDAHARKLFRTTHGHLVFFYLHPVNWADDRLAYRISMDDGETWTDSETVGVARNLNQLAVTEASDGTFLVTYYEYDSATGDREIFFHTAVPTPAGLDVGAPHTIASGITSIPTPTTADLGEGVLGRRVASGFARYNDLTGGREYVVSFSEDGGVNWGPPTLCRASPISEVFEGIVASQGDRLHCFTNRWGQSLSWSEWNGATWSPQIPLGVGRNAFEPPSAVTADDGALHLVTEEEHSEATISHAWLPSGVDAWRTQVAMGRGAAPVLSTVGTSLHVFAYEEASYRESRIRPAVAADGQTWEEAASLGGRTFDHVLDHNDGWAFEKKKGDLLFALTDSEGDVGNRTGLAAIPHRLDDADDRVSFSFVAPGTQVVDLLRLWVAAEDAPTVRIGLQGDAGGDPTGRWLDEVSAPGGVVLSGAYTDVSLGTLRGDSSRTFRLPETTLEEGERYHVVVEPSPGPLEGPPSESRWVEVDAVEVEADAVGDSRVLDSVAPGSWTLAPGEIPLMRLWKSGGDAVVDQTVRPTGFEDATEYEVPAESFIPDRDVAPSEVRVYLTQVGDPDAPVTLRILDEDDAEVWSGTGTPGGRGWFELPASGPALQAGSRYTLVVDSPNRDTGNAWRLPTSGDRSDDEASWGGSESSVVRAPDRPGFNDRSVEASEEEEGFFGKVALFNSTSQDALYLGDDEPFDFVRLLRQSWPDPGHEISPPSVTYWDGTSWAALSPTRNTFGDRGSDESIAFDPPGDWNQRGVDGRSGYWLRITSVEDPPKALVAWRLTAIRQFTHPTVAPTGTDTIALAWNRGTEPKGVEFLAYDAVPPSTSETSPIPVRGP